MLFTVMEKYSTCIKSKMKSSLASVQDRFNRVYGWFSNQEEKDA